MEEYTRKKRGRSNIFRSCFSSFTADQKGEKPFSCDKSDSRSTGNRRLRKAVLMAINGRKQKGDVPNNNFLSGNGSDTRRRLISRLLKSDWFDSLVVKKIHKNSSKLLTCSIKNESFLSIDETESSDLLSSSSQTTCSSSYFTSTLSDQKASSSTNSVDFRHQISFSSIPVQKLNSRKTKSRGNNWNIRLCLFLILSLVVLIVYGRIFSILCTSALFYFLPSRKIKRVNSVSGENQYKKKVMMAGLLDRARINPLR